MKLDKLILSVLEMLKERGMKLFYIVLVLLVVGDIFVPKTEPEFTGHTWVGFYAFYGFISCVLIIVISKALGKLFLFKKEDFYD